MPSSVVMTKGMKARPSWVQPGRCLAFFSAALASKRAAALVAALAT